MLEDKLSMLNVAFWVVAVASQDATAILSFKPENAVRLAPK